GLPDDRVSGDSRTDYGRSAARHFCGRRTARRSYRGRTVRTPVPVGACAVWVRRARRRRCNSCGADGCRSGRLAAASGIAARAQYWRCPGTAGGCTRTLAAGYVPLCAGALSGHTRDPAGPSWVTPMRATTTALHLTIRPLTTTRDGVVQAA